MTTSIRRLLPLLLFLGALLPSRGARATMIDPLELPDLVRIADRVALGRVESLRARWTEDGRAIVTEVVVVVERGLKGGLRAGERVTVLREGGEVGEVGMRVSGAARFAVGEEVVVFLERRGRSTFTVGMTLGKMHVDSVAGVRFARREIAGLGFTRPPALSAMVRPLDELLVDIEALVRRGAGSGK